MARIKILKTKHLDGSPCLLHKNMPKKSKIAYHWREQIYEVGLFFDWTEPSCWACGHFAAEDDSEEIIDFNSLSLKERFFAWDIHDYLERSHVIPRGLGGCSCAGNLVLLCKGCHKDNPDTDNPENFLKWMQNRKPIALKKGNGDWKSIR